MLLAVGQVLLILAFLWTEGTWSALWAGWFVMAFVLGVPHLLVMQGARA